MLRATLSVTSSQQGNPYLELEDELSSRLVARREVEEEEDEPHRHPSRTTVRGGAGLPAWMFSACSTPCSTSDTFSTSFTSTFARNVSLCVLLVKTTLPFILSNLLTFFPDVVNVYVASGSLVYKNSGASTSDSELVDVSPPASTRTTLVPAIGLGQLVLNGLTLSLVSGLNQGLDVYVPNSHLASGKEYFALVYLGRAHALDLLLLVPAVLGILLLAGPCGLD
ncbi:unnamed protein product, partial [Amoebophrya sp. A120]|eukprot:GSA120T00019464001.1